MSAQKAPTQYVDVKGTKIAYRRFGNPSATPLLFLTHFRGTMDLIDPLLLNSIATSRSLILLDNAGVGHSSGSIQPTIQEAGATVVDFLNAIGVPKVDIIGFSMGGFIAQTIALAYPQVVNKIVLAGTQSAYTEGFTSADPSIMSAAGQSAPDEEAMMKLFFYPSDTSKALGAAWWKRVQERNVEGEQRTTFVGEAGAQQQVAAITGFVSDLGIFEKMKQIEMPTLITNGKADIMTPTPNSYLLQQHMKNAELHIYPDSGHGHLYQFPEQYAKYLEVFLG
ncbi:alpha beta fold family protein [Stemphylium lycopersici]|uniref:Alpha beta fold family protein n=1 Tax=Stemphylium lycopersici TaxID=183478 RepID=A0A364NCB5_STELY|nr:alpha beta fold family protein [Stemphylium lycopersici]RAR11660.1 alpha beta fold family protein [Stemphylium lycopersici]RAR14837.1 alpha beta fold family protein [Stemphylium lycopersici]